MTTVEYEQKQTLSEFFGIPLDGYSECLDPTEESRCGDSVRLKTLGHGIPPMHEA